MKKLSVKTITGLLIASGVVTAVGYTIFAKNNLFETNPILAVNDVGEFKKANVLEEAENQVKEAQTKVETADQELAKATNAKKEAQAEFEKATEAIEKAEIAKSEAEAQVKAAKTENERKVAEEKVKAMEEKIKKAESTKKAAEAKVETATENVRKAEDNKKMVEEQVQAATKENIKVNEVEKEQVKTVVQEEQTKKEEEPTTENRTLPQWALDIAAANEQKAKEEQAKIEADNKNKADQAKAERAEKAAEEERKRQEREAWEADIKKQSDVVNGYDTYDRSFNFSSTPSNAAEERYLASLDRVKSKVSGIVTKNANITVDKSVNLANGQIWWVEMSCDLTKCEGFTGHFNTAKVSVRLEGLRDSIENITLTAPKAKAGYKFVGWKTYTVTYTVNDTKIDIRGCEAVYEPF